jgi:hypothetical protein
MTDDNGILGSVPGKYIAEGSHGLPPAETAADEPVTVAVDAAWLGVVLITYERQRMRHGKHSHWAWVAVWAEQAKG